MKRGNICCFLWLFEAVMMSWLSLSFPGALWSCAGSCEPCPKCSSRGWCGQVWDCREFPAPVRGLPVRGWPEEGNVGFFVHPLNQGIMWSFCHSLLFLSEEGMAVLNEWMLWQWDLSPTACFGPLALLGLLFPFCFLQCYPALFLPWEFK